MKTKNIELTQQQINKIIDMKVNQCVKGVHYVYLHEDKTIHLGRIDQYGQKEIVGFGGHAVNQYQAKEQIDLIIAQGRTHGDHITII